MSITVNNKIDQRGSLVHVEHQANAAISPGMLMEVMSTGKVKAHATAGGFSERLFAKEDALQGKTKDDAYAEDDMVMGGIARSGDLVLALLYAGSSYSIGNQLISHGDGTLYPTTGTPKQIIATVMEAVDLSASGAENTLALVRVN